MDLPGFLYEACSLKNVPRSGWFKVGIKCPESVAEHSFLTAIIAFFLGMREFGSVDDACRCAAAALFHDVHESRTLDLHRLAKSYVQADEGEVRREQLSVEGGEKILDLLERYEAVVHDADRIELFIQSRVYGLTNPDARVYGDGIELKTEAGRKLLEELRSSDPRWWMKFEVHR